MTYSRLVLEHGRVADLAVVQAQAQESWDRHCVYPLFRAEHVEAASYSGARVPSTGSDSPVKNDCPPPEGV